MPLTTSNQPAGADGGEIQATVREIVKDKLKSNAPGLSDCTRTAIARSIAMSVSAALASTAGAGAGDWQPTDKIMEISRKRLRDIQQAWANHHDLDEGNISFLLRMAGCYLREAPAVPASPRSGAGEGEGRVPAAPGYSAQPEPARGLGPSGEYSSRNHPREVLRWANQFLEGDGDPTRDSFRCVRDALREVLS